MLYCTGVLGRHGVEIPLDRITNINYHQGIWAADHRRGYLDIESAGEEGDTHFDNVRHPDDVQNEIYTQMEHLAHRGAEAGADGRRRVGPPAMARRSSSAGSDVASKIEQLARLRDEGHITAAEFEGRKNRLLISRVGYRPGAARGVGRERWPAARSGPRSAATALGEDRRRLLHVGQRDECSPRSGRR